MSNKTKEQLEQNIANMEAELQQMHSTLTAMDKPKGRFVKPEKGNPYWAVASTDNEISPLTWDDDEYDNNLWRLGDAYHTEEDAEDALTKRRMRTDILRRIEELNEGWTPDWTDGNQSKYYLCYINSIGFVVHNYYGIQYLPDGFYLKNKHAANQLLSEFTAAELKLRLL